MEVTPTTVATNSGCESLPPVARYFFNEFDGAYKRDDLGLDLPTIEKARLEALRYAGEAMRDQPELAWKGD